MIGVGVFLLILGYILSVVPGLIDPFSQAPSSTLVADRLATQISEGMLGQPDRPTVLNETCTFAFFNASLGSGGGCSLPFDASQMDLNTRLGVQATQSINVTIQRDVDDDGLPEQLRTDGQHVSTSGSTTLAIGPKVPTGQSVVAATRTAYLDGKDVSVVVRVW